MCYCGTHRRRLSNEERVEGDQQLEALAERIARIALRMMHISRERSEGCGGNEEPRKKTHEFHHIPTKEQDLFAIESDYFSPTPLFDDRQFERMFRVTKSIVKLKIYRMLHDSTRCLADKAQQVYVDRRVAEVRLHAELYGLNHQQDHTMTNRECQLLESLRYQYMQRGWECLFDLHEHLRLR